MVAGVTITTATGAPGQYNYVYLPTPVAITGTGSGTQFTLQSTEVNGGDQWYDDNTFVIWNTNIATSGGRSDNGAGGGVGTSIYVPVNFLYTVP